MLSLLERGWRGKNGQSGEREGWGGAGTREGGPEPHLVGRLQPGVELGREAMELRRGATTLAAASASVPDLGGANIYPMTTVARQTGWKPIAGGSSRLLLVPH